MRENIVGKRPRIQSAKAHCHTCLMEEGGCGEGDGEEKWKGRRRGEREGVVWLLGNENRIGEFEMNAY